MPWGRAQAVMQSTGRKNLDMPDPPQFQQFFIARDETVRTAGQSSAENGNVREISARAGIEWHRGDESRAVAQEPNIPLHAISRELELLDRVLSKLVKDMLRQHDFVGEEAGFEHDRAESVRTERCQQHVRVQDNSQETSSKTSSSVR